MPHQRTYRNFINGASAIWDFRHHDSLLIFPDPGIQSRITFSVESISTIPFQAGASNIKILGWGQHDSNLGIPFLISFTGTFRKTWEQQNAKSGTRVELATGLGNLQAIGIWTPTPCRFGSRLVQQPVPLPLGGPDYDCTYHPMHFARCS
jgi:hypothetical protein